MMLGFLGFLAVGRCRKRPGPPPLRGSAASRLRPSRCPYRGSSRHLPVQLVTGASVALNAAGDEIREAGIADELAAIGAVAQILQIGLRYWPRIRFCDFLAHCAAALANSPIDLAPPRLPLVRGGGLADGSAAPFLTA